MKPMNRAVVLEKIEEHFSCQSWTTEQLAQKLGVRERQVIGVVGWLRAGNLVERAGIERRQGKSRPYSVHLYRWRGIKTIRRVTRSFANSTMLTAATALRLWHRS